MAFFAFVQRRLLISSAAGPFAAFDILPHSPGSRGDELLGIVTTGFTLVQLAALLIIVPLYFRIQAIRLLGRALG